MSLTDQINADLKVAMKSGDKVRLNTVRSIRALLIELSKRGTGAVSADDELAALLAAAKKRKEAIEVYDSAGRKDLADIERTELAVIQEYLPQPMTRDDAAAVIVRIVEQSGASTMKDLGKVMPSAMKELKGKVDGSVIQELVKARLGGGA
ncbi:MAG: GatB/YqeY domain-containing protein [Bacteroidota bacterium]